MSYFKRCFVAALILTSGYTSLQGREPLPRPLSLEDAEIYAVAHNRSICALRHQLNQRCLGQQIAAAAWKPSIGSGIAVERDANQTVYTSKLSVNQTIFSASAYYELPRSSMVCCLSRVNLQAAINRLLFSVRSKYYEIVLAAEDLEVAEENLRHLTEGLAIEQRKFDGGENSRFEVDQAKVNVANALSSVYRVQRVLKVARNDLLELLGLDTCDQDALELVYHEVVPVLSIKELAEKISLLGAHTLESTKVDVQEGDVQLLTGEAEPGGPIFTQQEMWLWEDRALNCRPEVVRAFVLKGLAAVDVHDRQGQWYPRVSSYGAMEHKSKEMFEYLGSQVNWKGGVTFSWDVYDGARNPKICAAKAAFYAAEEAYCEQIQSAKLEVRDRFFEMEEAMLSYFAASQGMLLAQEGVRLAKEQLDDEQITPLEFRDATRALTQAQLDFNRASFSLLRSYYALRRDTGVDVS